MREGRPGVALTALIALVAPATGCSLLFVTRPPPARESTRNVDCTRSNVAPVIDTLVAGWQVIRTLIALTANDSAYANAPISRGADVGVGVGLFTLFAGSAGWGYNATSECREILGDDDGPPSRRPPPRVQRQRAKEEEAAEEAAVQARAAQLAGEQANAAAAAAGRGAATPADPAAPAPAPPAPAPPAPAPPSTAPSKPATPAPPAARQQPATE